MSCLFKFAGISIKVDLAGLDNGGTLLHIVQLILFYSPEFIRFIGVNLLTAMAHTMEYTIQLLTNGTHKFWYEARSRAASDKLPGDQQIGISRNDMRITISVCNSLLKWEEVSTHGWSIQFDPITEQLKLTIDGQFCRYAYDGKRKFLTLEMPQWAEPIVLQ